MDGGLHGRGGGRRDDGRRAGHVAGRAAGAARSTLNFELCSFRCSRDWRADRRRVASHMHVKRGDGGIRAGTRRRWGVGGCVEGGRRGEAGGRVPGAAAVESRVHSVATHIALIHMSRIKPKIWWGGGRRPWGLYQCLHRARPHHIFGVAPCVDTGTLVSMRSVSKYSFLPTDGPARSISVGGAPLIGRPYMGQGGSPKSPPKIKFSSPLSPGRRSEATAQLRPRLV